MGINLAPKLVLREKGASANLPTLKQAKITLRWQSKVDLDLMAFGTKADGTNFSIFTKNLRGSQGDLNSFPFIQLDDDQGVGAVGGDKEENMTIMKIDPSIKELHIICLNYTAARAQQNDSFSNYDATINIINDKGECLVQGQLNDSRAGVVAHLCTIRNGAIGAEFVNQNSVYDLQGIVNAIPSTAQLFS